MRKVILYLAANPYDTATLPELSKEIKEVKREIRNSKYGGNFDFQPVYAASPMDFRTEVVELRPHIVHFSGHGDGDAGIIIDSDSCAGESNRVTGEMLERFFRQFDFVECVVLNACYSTAQAEQLHRCVNYVIGIDGEIGDESAREFSASFYNALGNGYSIESAFEMSRSYLSMKKKQVECEPRLFKRKGGQRQVEDGEPDASPGLIDPFKDLAAAAMNLLTRQSHGLSKCSTDACRDAQTLMFQWIAVCMVALVLAAGISMGPADSLFGIFRLVAVLTSPLLQWMVVKNWMRSVPWWQWFFGTILGAMCGWYFGESITYFMVDSVLNISLSGTADLACWYEECIVGGSDAVVLTMINLTVNSLCVGGAVGAIQGWLLQRSFLRVRLRKWVLASMAGLALGSLLGLLPVLYDVSLGGKTPDDLLFALFLGAAYGIMTGRVLLSYADAPSEIKLSKSVARPPQPVHEQLEFEYLSLGSTVSVPAEFSNSADKVDVEEPERSWARQVSRFATKASRWLDVQRSSPRVANWALALAVLAVYFTFRRPLLPLAVFSALAAVYCVRQVALNSAKEPHGGGRKRVKLARFLSYTVLAISLLQAMLT